MKPLLRLHGFVPRSRANGPGARAVVWTQGCSLGCPGCFNPESHDTHAGTQIAADALFERIRALGDAIEGVTISGGEPLQQRRALLPLLQRIRRETALSSLLFTGFELAEVARMPQVSELFACLDVVIAGRFDATRWRARGLRGSANQIQLFLTPRYDARDLERVPAAELIVTAEGRLVSTGIDPVSP